MNGRSRYPPIEADHLAGDIVGLLGGQESDQVRHFLRRAGTLHRHQGLDLFRFATLLDHPRFDKAQRNHIDGHASGGDLPGKRFGGAVEPRFGRCVIRLASIAELGRDRRNRNDPSPPRADHRKEQRLSHVEKAAQRDRDHVAPLVRPHARHRGIVVDACIVHEHLDGTGFQNLRQGPSSGLGIANIEAGYAGRPACSDDLLGYLLSRSAIAMRMDNDVQALLRQLSADRGAI